MKTSLKTLFSIAIVLISAAILITACKKNSSSSTATPNDNSAAANLSTNGATADNAFDDALNIGVQTGYAQNIDNLNGQKNGSTTLGYNFCATVTVKPTPGTTFPDTLIVDFGNGCTSTDGILRSGSITYIFSGKLSTPGTTISATFNNYVLNGDTLEGVYSITNASTLSAITFTTSVTNGKISYPNDTSYSFSGTKTAVLQIPPSNISDPTTFVFDITGGYTVSDSYGESLTATVSTPLVREETCKNIVQGVTSFKYTNGNASLSGDINYGNGTCDNLAVITIGSFTETVTLP